MSELIVFVMCCKVMCIDTIFVKQSCFFLSVLTLFISRQKGHLAIENLLQQTEEIFPWGLPNIC